MRIPKFDLLASTRAELLRRGFLSEMPALVNEEAESLASAPLDWSMLRDLRDWPWSSIDNRDSKDLDQIECAERVPDGIRVSVAIADVASRVPLRSAVDDFARAQTSSLYPPGHVFPMLPAALSHNATSLLPQEDRAAVVISMLVHPDGTITGGGVQRALVCNRYALAYNNVGAWLSKRGQPPEPIANNHEMQEQLRLQDEAARCLRRERQHVGALFFASSEPRLSFVGGQPRSIAAHRANRAHYLIESLMVAANQCVARFLEDAGVTAIQRIVKSPKRWDAIVAFAAKHGASLPPVPDVQSLANFLSGARKKDQRTFAEVSLAVLTRLGSGEYGVAQPGEDNGGHFALALNRYAHSTAPNRRFIDLVMQRILLSVLSAQAAPYHEEELDAIAQHCTEREDAAEELERLMQKKAAAYALRARVHQRFRGVVASVTPSGTFVRVQNPPVGGRLVSRHQSLRVGDRIQMTLLSVDPEKGFIDFGLES